MQEFDSKSGHKGPEQKEQGSYAHHEVIDKLDLYSKMADKDEYFFLQKLKLEYMSLSELTDQHRVKQDIHYGQGLKAGLPHVSHGQLKEEREKQDQKKRRMVVERARKYYTQNVRHLSKEFDKEKGSPEPRKATGLTMEFNKTRDDSSYKDHQHIKRLNRYIQIAGPDKSQFFQELKSEYIQRMEDWKKKENKEGRQPLVFQNIEDQKEELRKKAKRDDSAEKAKEEYSKDHSLKKEFNKVGIDHEHHKLLSQIDNYIGETGPEYSGYYQQLRQEYLNTTDRWKVARKAQDQLYTMGVRDGMPQVTHEMTAEARRDQDKEHRQEILSKAKEHYDAQHGLKNIFGDGTNRDGRDMRKEI